MTTIFWAKLDSYKLMIAQYNVASLYCAMVEISKCGNIRVRANSTE